MTTGRINQVTTDRNTNSMALQHQAIQLTLFARLEFVNGFKGFNLQTNSDTATVSPPSAEAYKRVPQSTIPPPCSSISQSSSSLLPVLLEQRSWPSVRTTSDRRHLKGMHCSHGGSPSGYLTDGFGHRQVIHIPLSSRALITNVRSSTGKDLERSKALATVRSPFPSQRIPIYRRVNDSVHR